MTTWDPSRKGAGITLSNGNLTAAQNAAPSTWNSVYSTTSKSSGKYYCVYNTIQCDSQNGFIIGVGNSSAPTGNYSGSDANSSGIQNIGNVYGGSGSASGYSAGQQLLLAVDVAAKKFWLRVAGTWTGTDNPSTGVGGITFTWSGAVFLSWSGFDGTAPEDHLTMAPATEDSDTKLSGFSSWDVSSVSLALSQTIPVTPTATITVPYVNSIYLTAGTTSWTVPDDWNSSNNSIWVIGGGGGGQTNTSNSAHNVGGGGGAASNVTNLTLTPGASITVAVGTGGGAGVNGGDTYFNGASLAASTVGAKGGTNGASGGAGGAAGSGTGTTKYSGGSGGANTGIASFGGGSGGGGAAGQNGDGKNGGTVTSSNNAGSGGGASGGGSDGSTAGSSTGGNGGASFDATPGGTGGTQGNVGNPGSHGSGGGGSGADAGVGRTGGAGGAGVEFDATHGSGGGGGGGGDLGSGGAGGLYGGGGGANGAGGGSGGSGANGLIIITYTPVDARTLSLNKTISVTPTESLQVLVNAALSKTITPTITARFDIGGVHLALSQTIAVSSTATFSVVHELALSKTITPTLTSTFAFGPVSLSLDATVPVAPYLRLIPTQYETASLDPFHDPVWIAVEIDVFLIEDDSPITLRMGNRGVIKRTVEGVLYNYPPRLSGLPVELGTTITVTSYGSPVRGQPNGGIIRFAIDESIWNWFTDYRWIGQTFRVYYGLSNDPVEADVDLDLTLFATGIVANLKHDSIQASIQTSDQMVRWDDPLIQDYYDETFPEALRGKPKPYLWGFAFGLEPTLEVEATQVYGVSYRAGGLDFIDEVRVGGIPWRLNAAGPPIQGEWTPDLANGTFQLGSPPLGMDVRCDAQQGRFTIAQIMRDLLNTTPGTTGIEQVDEDYMGRLDVAMPGPVSYYTSTTPVNRLAAVDDLLTNSGCWWAAGQPLNKGIAGVIDAPAVKASYLLDETNIDSIELNTIQPPAWGIRVGFRRNWSPQTNFLKSVLQAEQKKWSESGQVNVPPYINNEIKAIETRSVEVPLLNGTFVNQGNANAVQQRLVPAWGTIRSLFDVKAFIRPEDIKLYDTVAVDYMMITGNFRITSAIRAIGGGPSTLQLWGTIGPFAVQPAPVVITPPVGGGGFTGMGVWQRNSGSGTFEIGVDTPSTVTSINIRGVGGGGGGAGAVQSGGFFYAGGGGGSGGYFQDSLIVTAGEQFSWSVGSGGAGMAYGVFGSAGDGGDTTFGTAIGNGGKGGQVLAISQAGGAGGQASGATVLISGAAGGNGYSTADPPGECCDQFTANGAASYFGGGKHAATTLETFQGAPGSGGGGHVGINPATSSSGENGTIIVEWFVGVSS